MKFLSRLEYKFRTFKEQVGAFVEFNFFKLARQTDRSFLLQIWECLWGWLRYGLLPKSYYNYRLYEDRAPLSKKVRSYVSDHSYFSKLGQVNMRNNVILSNKWVFHNYFDNYPVSLPKCWGYFHNNGGIWTETGEVFGFEELPAIFKRMDGHKVVIKPIRGSSGSRIVVADVLCEDDRVSLLVSGAKVPLEEFALNFKKSNYIIEERLPQHSALNAIYPHSVNTVRINTLYDTREVKLWGAIIKLGTGSAEIDNWGKGSLCVGIDIETGKMLTGSHDIFYSKKILAPFRVHPDTKAQFEGVELPYWQELKETVRKAAQLAPILPYIAWDVAITPEGPCIIEGNGRSDLSMVQVHGGLNTPEAKEFWRQFGINI
ncbi:MAG: sugar-transfer associated ATP-grasp domain-containing protein [Eubacteriales bacterium]|nr:sugar-transfer associated ATP-grasp domain-containing protein [Eubacteriales bacterium]